MAAEFESVGFEMIDDADAAVPGASDEPVDFVTIDDIGADETAEELMVVALWVAEEVAEAALTSLAD